MLEELKGKEFPVLNAGHVVLVDVMGGDADVVAAARTSYQKGTRKTSDDRTLIRYLMRHRHSSPFEACQIKLHVKLPIFVERQWARHRTAGWNEVSARYSELPEEYYVPEADAVREQSKTNKQGRGDELSRDIVEQFQTACRCTGSDQFRLYHQDLNSGVARELARVNLPLSTYTEKVWWINLHNLLHFLGLRMDSHAQQEIREYATVIGEQIVAPLFPLVWEAFQDYRLGGMFLTRLDREMIVRVAGHAASGIRKTLFVKGIWQELTGEPADQRSRERDECMAKLERLGLIPTRV